MAGGHAWQGGMPGKGACMTGGGMYGRGHVWQGDMHGRGHVLQGCMCGRGGHVWQEGMHGRGHMWQGGMHDRWGHSWQERRPLQWAVRILLECILKIKVLLHRFFFLFMRRMCSGRYTYRQKCLKFSRLQGVREILS